jgi:hypothetical protein
MRLWTIAPAAAKDSDGGMLRNDYELKDLGDKVIFSHWFLQDRKEINAYALNGAKVQGQRATGAEKDPDRHKTHCCFLKIHEDKESPTVTLEPWLAFSDKEKNWFRCTVVGPRAHRGWCLQERLLPHRVLLQTASDLLAACL